MLGNHICPTRKVAVLEITLTVPMKLQELEVKISDFKRPDEAALTNLRHFWQHLDRLLLLISDFI